MWYIRLKTWPDHWWPEVYARGCLGIWFYVNDTDLSRADAFDEEQDALEELGGWEKAGEVGVGEYEVVYIGEGDGES